MSDRLYVYRVGWPSLVSKPKKVGRWWIYIGPYIIGQVDRWDREPEHNDDLGSI